MVEEPKPYKNKMKKQIVGIILGIAMISLASAMFAGETIYYDFQGKVETINSITWEVIDNSSNLDGLNIIENSTGANVSIANNFKPDNFTIIFTINGQYEVVKSTGQQPGGGGSSYTKKKVVEVKNETEIPDFVKWEDEEEESDLEVWTNAIEEKSPIRIIVIVILLSILTLILLKNVVKHFNKNKRVEKKEKFNEEILNNKQGEND